MPQNKNLKFVLRDRKFIWIVAIGIILTINTVGYLGAYTLTNYREKDEISLGNIRPQNNKIPEDFELSYTSDRIVVNSQEWIATWSIKSANSPSKGTVILFHGKDSTKSSLLASAKVFHRLGYDSLLVDFRGGGNSSGSKTTVGVKESQDVILAIDKVEQSSPNKPIFLYGISMGSAAILRAIAVHDIKPDAIILELPFATLLSAVKIRLNRSKIPSFPLGELMVFWGGIHNRFNGFAHNPITYATQVNCPTLILQGELDSSVDRQDIEKLYQNIGANKKLVNFPQAGHQLLVTVDENLWQSSINNFLRDLNRTQEFDNN